MGVHRPVPVKLDVADSDADLLQETISELSWAAGYVLDYASHGEYKPTSRAQLHRDPYDGVRAETRHHTNPVRNARNKTADAIQSVLAHWQRGEYGVKPHFSAPTLVYDKPCATFRRSIPFQYGIWGASARRWSR